MIVVMVMRSMLSILFIILCNDFYNEKNRINAVE